jgi:uncharacterized protein YjbI with pentapeptide repeats
MDRAWAWILLFQMVLAPHQIQGLTGQEPRNAPSTPFEMQSVLERHARWLASGGTDGSRADLRQITLEGVNSGLSFILSSGVVLRGADLRRADFR